MRLGSLFWRDGVYAIGAQSRHCSCERRDLILTREYVRSSPRGGVCTENFIRIE
jgi:hypothetical protein